MTKRVITLALLGVLVAGCGGQQRRTAVAAPVWCPSHVLRFATAWPAEQRAIRRNAVREGYDVGVLIRINRRQLLRYAAIRRFNASRLIGWDAQKARSFVLRHGCEWQVVMRNGVDLIVASDSRTDRVDVSMSRGIVRQVSVG